MIIDFPQEGLNVIMCLTDGSELMGYWSEGFWWTGIENNPDDVKVVGVVSWREIE